jgi:hypothetical protein
MAQDPSKVIRNPRGSTPGSPGLSSPSDTEHLRQQIADTRAGMTETIDAIQDRVNPRNVMSRAKDNLRQSTVGRVRDMAQSAGSSVRSLAETAGSRLKNASDSAGSAAGYVMARTAKPRAQAARMARQYPVAAAVVGGAVVFLLIRALRGRRGGYLYEEAL